MKRRFLPDVTPLKVHAYVPDTDVIDISKVEVSDLRYLVEDGKALGSGCSPNRFLLTNE